jgi:hypothetical protein
MKFWEIRAYDALAGTIYSSFALHFGPILLLSSKGDSLSEDNGHELG